MDRRKQFKPVKEYPTPKRHQTMERRSFEPSEIPTPELHQLLVGTVAPRPIALVSTVSEQETSIWRHIVFLMYSVPIRQLWCFHRIEKSATTPLRILYIMPKPREKSLLISLATTLCSKWRFRRLPFRAM